MKYYKVDANTLLNSYLLHCQQMKRVLELGALEGFEKQVLITALYKPDINTLNKLEIYKLPKNIISFIELTKIVIAERLV